MTCDDMIEKCRAVCCGCFPIHGDLLTVHKDKIQVEYESVEVEYGLIVPITQDAQCVFLNRKTYHCEIYTDRPDVCKKYGMIDDLPCPYLTSKGDVRTRSERRRILRKAEKELKRMMPKANAHTE